MSMTAGKFDRQIIVQQRSRVQEGTGELVDGWQPVFNGPLWAQKIEGRSIERWLGSQLAATVVAAFRLRWYRALLDIYPDTHRVTYTKQNGDAVTYLIDGCNEIGRREGVILYCTGRGENPTSDIPAAEEDSQAEA